MSVEWSKRTVGRVVIEQIGQLRSESGQAFQSTASMVAVVVGIALGLTGAVLPCSYHWRTVARLLLRVSAVSGDLCLVGAHFGF